MTHHKLANEEELRKEIWRFLPECNTINCLRMPTFRCSICRASVDNILKLLTSEIEKAKVEAYDLLFWKYKELNGQTVDRKFVEAYNALTEETLQEEQK